MSWLAPAQVLRTKTHCVHGHPLSGDNVFRKDDGYRRCRQCSRDDQKAYYWRKRAAA